MRRLIPDARRYGLAILASLVALLVREMLSPLFGVHNPYHTVWLAAVFSAWYCGVGPSVVGTLLSVVGVWYLFLPPQHSFALQNPQVHISGLVGFVVFSGFTIALGEANRRSKARSERELAERKQIEDELRKSHQELEHKVKQRTAELEHNVAEMREKAALLDLANDAIFVKGLNGAISYWNQGAERLYGWTKEEAVGRPSHELLHTEFPVPLAQFEARDYWEGELRHTRRDGSQIVVASRWTTLRDNDGKAVAWLEICTDITSRRRAEEAARKLSGRLLTLQDEERRKMARGLHDSLGQYLAALKMNLALLSTADGHREKLASECSEIVDECLTETRTISHLLHPPLLDEAGFASAAHWYVDGFAQRSGIKVDINLPPKLDRLHKDVEIALFRALQEGLTNVHRHSGASTVDIRVRVDTGHVHLEISDNGRGIPKERLTQLTDGDGTTGVGIAGMRERVRELHGSLEIKSNRTGTKVILAIPLPQRTSLDSAQDEESRQTVSAA
jgi:two-component system, NarL family, sensor kinase